MTKVVVTGASGLIGSQVVQTLVESGMDVIATVRTRPERLRDQLAAPVEVLDVLNPGEAPWEACLDKSADVLIHCATANDIVSRNPANGMQLSVTGTWNVLEWARRNSIARVIYFSTFQVYGTEVEGIVAESRPVHCESAYGLNHWFGEEVCRLFSQKHAMSVAVVRPSNVYGAPAVSTVQRETLVPACFVRSALTSNQLTLHSSGKQRRNFVSTVEVAKACAHLASTGQAGFQIYNICSAYSASILDIARLTAEVYREQFGRELPIQVQSSQPVEGNRFEARSKLDFLWVPATASEHQMRTEIGRMVERMSSELSVVSQVI
jgi:UDP-glucose 4-epimerase